MDRSHEPRPASIDGTRIDADRLADDLAELASRGPAVPAAVDETILAEARRRLGPARTRRRRGFPAAAIAAVAMIAVTAWIAHRVTTTTTGPADRLPIAADLDDNGRVDILDAFLLARRLATGAAPAAADLNGDGLVDADDVDAIAARAVALDGEIG